jgi:hypothetical protein
MELNRLFASQKSSGPNVRFGSKKADIRARPRDVRFVPPADSCTAAIDMSRQLGYSRIRLYFSRGFGC